MSATDTIRAMLGERGVECWDMKTRGVWFGINGREHRFEAHEQTDGLIEVSIYDLTPEQAIEATLGRGECERLQDENERLRSCLSDSAENSKQIMHEAHMQAEENDKLRELVRDMYACVEALCSMVENSPGCSMCPTNQDEEKPCAAADVYCRMRELGVEV